MGQQQRTTPTQPNWILEWQHDYILEIHTNINFKSNNTWEMLEKTLFLACKIHQCKLHIISTSNTRHMVTPTTNMPLKNMHKQNTKCTRIQQYNMRIAYIILEQQNMEKLHPSTWMQK